MKNLILSPLKKFILHDTFLSNLLKKCTQEDF